MSHTVLLTLKDRKHAEKLAKKRVQAKPKHIRFNDSGYHDNPHRWYPHMIGLLGEMAFSKITGMPINEEIYAGGDRGDFGTLEIKTRMCKDRNPLLIVKKREWERKSPKRYILMRLDPSQEEAEVLGWISRGEFDELKSPLFLYGREVYTVRATQLRQFRPRKKAG